MIPARGPQTDKRTRAHGHPELDKRIGGQVPIIWAVGLGKSRQELAKRIRGQVPIIWAPVPLLVFRQEDRETGADNMGSWARQV